MLLHYHDTISQHCPLIPKKYLVFDTLDDVLLLKVWLLESDLSPNLYGPFPNYLTLFLWLARKHDVIA